MRATTRYSNMYMEAPRTASTTKRPLQKWAWMKATSSDETSSRNVSRWQPSSFLKDRRNLIAATAIISAVAVSFPIAAHADGMTLASIAGGATELATSTTNWVQSLTETGFYQAFTLVFLSEIGDKTFFMAGLLAIQTSKFTSFIGSMAALAVMTVISVAIGQVFHAVPAGISQGVPLDDVAAVLAFAFFGFKTLKDAIEMDPDSSVMDEELEEAEETVDESGVSKTSTKWYVYSVVMWLCIHSVACILTIRVVGCRYVHSVAHTYTPIARTITGHNC